MKAALHILLSVLCGLVGAWLLYNYAPLSLLNNGSAKPSFGSTITTINGSDTISSSRTVINTNFSNLNTDKLQSGSTAAALTITTGTIGTLTLTNPLTVANGGTASTTLSSNQLLLGNGTSLLKTVTGWGTSGQFLTSGGAGNPPTWTTSTIDQTANYNFTSSLFYVKNLFASSTVANPLTLNTVGYSFPSSQGSASTFLKNDGSGALTWSTPTVAHYTLVDISGVNPAAGAYGTTTSLIIPASTMTASSTIRVTGTGTIVGNGGGANFYLRKSDGTTLATFSLGTPANTRTYGFSFDLIVAANNSTSAERWQVNGTSVDTGTISSNVAAEVIANSGTIALDFSTGLTLVGVIQGAGSGDPNLTSLAIEVLP